MSDLRKAAEMALEVMSKEPESFTLWVEDMRQAREALRQALAQPEQEPVAWELRKGKTDRVLLEITNNPQRAHDWKASLEEVVPLYTAPPKREWVGLTEKEIDQCFEQCVIKNFNEDGTEQSIVSTYQAGQAIEDNLKEKNGG